MPDLLVNSTPKALDSLLNLFYPENCFICTTPMVRHTDCSICPDCLQRALALKIQKPSCPSCGLPMYHFEPDSAVLCMNCILDPPPYSGARAFGHYSGELASLVHGLKFFKKRNLVKILAPLLVETFQENWSRKAFDLILPVPLHAKRKRDRGYNQSELLAKILAARIGIPVDAKILTRIRATVSQVGLSNLERRANVRKAFSCLDPERVAGLRILLIDDVMTTGATAASASKALLKSGARRVSVLTLARTE